MKSNWANPPDGVAELEKAKQPAPAVTQFKGSPCWNCGNLLDVTTGPGKPRSGDISICFHCGELAAFDDKLGIHKLTEDELVEAMLDPKVRMMLQYLPAMRRVLARFRKK